MAISVKDKYLRSIAALIKKGSMHFEKEDRPSVMMGGRQVFVESVSYDLAAGALTYDVCNAEGVTLSSQHGIRPLDKLDSLTLKSVEEKVRMYDGFRQQRSANLVNIESRARGELQQRKPSRPRNLIGLM